MEQSIESFSQTDRKRNKEILLLSGTTTIFVVEEVLNAFPRFFYNDGNRVRMAHSSRSIIKSVTMEDSEIQQEQDEIYVLLQRIAIFCGTSSQLDSGWWVKPRSLVWFDRFLCEVYDDNRWLAILRVSRSIWLCDQVQSDIEKRTTNWRLPIPVTCRVGAALYRLARGCDLLEVGEKFGIGMSSSHYVVKEFVRAINKILVHHISWPRGEYMDMVIKRFYDKSGLPNCCGAIDATHITITKPYGVDGTDYYNRKQSYSVVLQGVCDTNRRFLDVFCGFPGSVHDSRILQNSGLYKRAEDKDILHGKPTYINYGFKVG
eukprot:Gb_17152 [translate_table: standard]